NRLAGRQRTDPPDGEVQEKLLPPLRPQCEARVAAGNRQRQQLAHERYLAVAGGRLPVYPIAELAKLRAVVVGAFEAGRGLDLRNDGMQRRLRAMRRTVVAKRFMVRVDAIPQSGDQTGLAD